MSTHVNPVDPRSRAAQDANIGIRPCKKLARNLSSAIFSTIAKNNCYCKLFFSCSIELWLHKVMLLLLHIF
jgi:hypothetical protein